MRRLPITLWLVVFTCPLALFAQDKAPEPKPDPKPGPAPSVASSEPQALSFPNPELAKLDRFTGAWNVVETHFDSLGKPIATVKGTEVISWQLDQHVFRRIYITGTDDTRFKAMGMVTWNQKAAHYTVHWFDNRSPAGPALATGNWQEDGQSLIFTMDALTADGKKSEFKVIERFEDDEHRVATTYQMSGKDLTKRLEVRYERAGPCPSSSQMRVITYPENE